GGGRPADGGQRASGRRHRPTAHGRRDGLRLPAEFLGGRSFGGAGRASVRGYRIGRGRERPDRAAGQRRAYLSPAGLRCLEGRDRRGLRAQKPVISNKQKLTAYRMGQLLFFAARLAKLFKKACPATVRLPALA